jgi:plastocyanin
MHNAIRLSIGGLVGLFLVACGPGGGSTDTGDVDATTDTGGTPMDTGGTPTDTGGTPTDTGGTPTDTGAAMPTVMVGPGLSFSPSALTITAGQTVRWVWAGSGHNVVSGMNGTPNNVFCSTSDTGCAAAPTSTTGTVYMHTFPTAGSFPYFCAPHSGAGMVGTITVQ